MLCEDRFYGRKNHHLNPTYRIQKHACMEHGCVCSSSSVLAAEHAKGQFALCVDDVETVMCIHIKMARVALLYT